MKSKKEIESSLYCYKAKIIDVYDGDSVTALVDLGFHTCVEMKLRLYGIDTPELRGAERPEGLKARNYLRELILDKEIYLQSIKDKQGKYGRYLAIIHLEKGEELLNVNEHLIKKEFAVERYY